jgi:hypothetical protein
MPMSEPFTDHLALDIVRCVTIAAAWWLCALIVKLTYQRWQTRSTDPDRYRRTHPATMASYAVALFFIGVRRADNLGDPWSWYLLPSIVILVLGFIGVLRRIRVPLTPPWRRAR